jgi:hypothetical protein
MASGITTPLNRSTVWAESGSGQAVGCERADHLSDPVDGFASRPARAARRARNGPRSLPLTMQPPLTGRPLMPGPPVGNHRHEQAGVSSSAQFAEASGQVAAPAVKVFVEQDDVRPQGQRYGERGPGGQRRQCVVAPEAKEVGQRGGRVGVGVGDQDTQIRRGGRAHGTPRPGRAVRPVARTGKEPAGPQPTVPSEVVHH